MSKNFTQPDNEKIKKKLAEIKRSGGGKELTQYLASEGIRVSDLSRENRLQILSIVSDEAVKTINVNEGNELGRTPLIRLIMNEEKEFKPHLMRILLNRGEDINTTDNDGTTICLHAAKAAVKQTDNILDLNFLDIFKEIARWVPSNVNALDENGDTALLILSKALPSLASRSDLLSHHHLSDIFYAIEILIKMGADLSAQDQEQKTIFDYVDLMPSSDLKEQFRSLLNYGLVAQLPSTEFNQEIKERIDKIKNMSDIESLITFIKSEKNSADDGIAMVNMENKIRILGIVAPEYRPSWSQFHIDIFYKMPNQRDAQGRSFYPQLLCNHIETHANTTLSADDKNWLVRNFILYLDDNINLNDRDNDGVTTAMHLINSANELRNWFFARIRLEKLEFNVDAADNKGDTVLLMVCKALGSKLSQDDKDASDLACFLIKKGANVNIKNSEGKSALDYLVNLPFEQKVGVAIDLPDGEIRNKILDNIDFTMVDEEGRSALIHFILPHNNGIPIHDYRIDYHDHISLVKGALDRGADVNIVDEYGTSPLHYAVIAASNFDVANKCYIWNKIKLVDLILEKNPNVNLREDRYLLTPLEMVIYDKALPSAELISKLAAKGADVNVLNANGQSALYTTAFKQDDAAACEALLKYGADYVDDVTGVSYDLPQLAAANNNSDDTADFPSTSVTNVSSSSAQRLVSKDDRDVVYR